MPASISKSTGTVVSDYLELVDSSAGGGADFYAGAHSVDGGGNTGWAFVAYYPADPAVLPQAGGAFDFLLEAGLPQVSDAFLTPPKAVRVGFVAQAGIFDDVAGADLRLEGAVTPSGPWADTGLSITNLDNTAVNSATGFALFSCYRIRAEAAGGGRVKGIVVGLPA